MTIGEYASKLNELERLQADVIRLQADSDRYKQQLEYQSSWRQGLKTKLDKAKEIVQTSIDEEEWTDEELSEPFWEELCEALEVELQKQYRVEITATWTATLKGPRGTTFDTLVEDIEIEEPNISFSSSSELVDVRETGSDVTEI